MKKLLAFSLALCLGLSLLGGAMAQSKDYSGVTIRIYSNSNSTERATWLKNEAQAAGFTISMDDNSVISGDTAAIQAANEAQALSLPLYGRIAAGTPIEALRDNSTTVDVPVSLLGSGAHLRQTLGQVL